MPSRLYNLKSAAASLDQLINGNNALGLGFGNVYHVVKTTDTNVHNYVQGTFASSYLDGSEAVHNTIASALTATVECRNDYVVVWPSDSDYDLTAALTLDKKCVHLVCPAGLGYDRGATNACRIEQTTASTAIMAVSDSSIEIAGFYLKPYIGCSHITLAATSYAPNIHHNTFVLKWTTSNAAAILCSGDGGAWGSVAEYNWFISQAGDDQTCASVITVGASATGARVSYNDFFIGDGNTATVVINNAATKGTVNYNNFQLAQGDGTMTHCIAVGTWGSAVGNRACVGDGAIMTGGAVDASFVDNMHALNGGTIDDAD